MCRGARSAPVGTEFGGWRGSNDSQPSWIFLLQVPAQHRASPSSPIGSHAHASQSPRPGPVTKAEGDLGAHPRATLRPPLLCASAFAHVVTEISLSFVMNMVGFTGLGWAPPFAAASSDDGDAREEQTPHAHPRGVRRDTSHIPPSFARSFRTSRTPLSSQREWRGNPRRQRPSAARGPARGSVLLPGLQDTGLHRARHVVAMGPAGGLPGPEVGTPTPREAPWCTGTQPHRPGADSQTLPGRGGYTKGLAQEACGRDGRRNPFPASPTRGLRRSQGP